MTKDLRAMIKMLMKIEQDLHDTGEVHDDDLDVAFEHVMDARAAISKVVVRMEAM